MGRNSKKALRKNLYLLIDLKKLGLDNDLESEKVTLILKNLADILKNELGEIEKMINFSLKTYQTPIYYTTPRNLDTRSRF